MSMDVESSNPQPQIHDDGEEVEREVVPEGTQLNEPVPTTDYCKSGDYAELIACGVFFVVCISVNVAFGTIRMRPLPFRRYQLSYQNGGVQSLYVENQVNSEDYSGKETIDDWLLYLLGIFLPLVVQLGLSARYGIGGDFHSTMCVYLVAFAFTLVATEALKNYVGYFRPIFFALCKPSADYSECEGDNNSGRKSFPSGHASTAFCGLSLLTLYIHERYGVPSRSVKIVQAAGDSFALEYTDGPPRMARIISILALAPMALAAFIAASRVVDNKHFPADIIGGAVLGTAISSFSHSLWFPTWPVKRK